MLTENSFTSLVNTTRENVCELLNPSLGNYHMQVCMENIHELSYLDCKLLKRRYNDFCSIGPGLKG